MKQELLNHLSKSFKNWLQTLQANMKRDAVRESLRFRIDPLQSLEFQYSETVATAVNSRCIPNALMVKPKFKA
jgi:hypothetical protein